MIEWRTCKKCKSRLSNGKCAIFCCEKHYKEVKTVVNNLENEIKRRSKGECCCRQCEEHRKRIRKELKKGELW